MRMRVVCVRNVGVGMSGRFMAAPMTVRAIRHHVVVVVVVPVVMPMRVLVFEWLVFVPVLVPLGQVHDHACQHQGAAGRHAPAKTSLAHAHRQHGADEGRKGKN